MVVQNVLIMKRHALERDIASQTSRSCLQHCEKGSLTVKENPAGRNGLMADLLVECKVCLDAKPLMSSSVTKSGQEIAVACAICHFHSGAASRVRKRLSIKAGVFTKRASQKKDKRQLKKSNLQVTAKEKKCRSGMQLLQTHRGEALREAEGITYEAWASN